MIYVVHVLILAIYFGQNFIYRYSITLYLSILRGDACATPSPDEAIRNKNNLNLRAVR
jgi:hypothetical protein